MRHAICHGCNKRNGDRPMASINIQLPSMDAEHSIEIEVRVNGEKQKYHYRIELFSWEECRQPENHANCLKEKIQKYDKQWQVVQIGGPTEENIPVMFKQVAN
jgi:hypothetical protein